MRSKNWLLAAVAYGVVGLIATYHLSGLPGIIGHNWDWSVNWNSAGAGALANSALSAWWRVELGAPNVGVSLAPYYYLAALFGGHPWLFSHLLILGLPVWGA